MFTILIRRFDLEIKTTPKSIRIICDLIIRLPNSDALRVDTLVSDILKN